ncbi:hypothetical protein GCM10027418_20040 [Mariniluteicoccus endophyticus]
MVAPRRLLAASLASTVLAMAGCANASTQAVPTVPWETPEAQPVDVPIDLPTPTAEPTPEAPAPEAPAAESPAPTPAAQPSSEPTQQPTPRATPSKRSTLPAKPKATAAPTKAGAPAPGPAVMSKGASGDEVRDLQARLAQLGWFSGNVTGYYGSTTSSAVAGFQSKRGLTSNGVVDRGTLTTLQSMTRTPTKVELGLEAPKTDKPAEKSEGGRSAAGLDPRCMTGRALCISKKTNTMKWVVDGQVKSTFAVRFGTKELPTREGSFRVQWKSRDHVSNIYHTPMPYALFFSGGQAVHYSPDFAARGYSGGSHGCVNVRDKGGMASLFNQVSVGDKVIVHR